MVIAFSSSSVSAAEGDEMQPTLEEDYAYPGADQILAETGITLIRGDGHILFADCGEDGDLFEVWSRIGLRSFCFKITRAPGYLELELPLVYGVSSDRALTSARVVQGGETLIEPLKIGWNGIGVGGLHPENGEATLVELRANE
jgi:hypothetical protein